MCGMCGQVGVCCSQDRFPGTWPPHGPHTWAQGVKQFSISPSQPDLQSASAVQFMILPVGAKSFQEAMKMGTEVNANV